jgi:hypothetical protein
MADWFHQCALAVGFVAHAEGWLHDSERVRAVVYHLYERGEWPADTRLPAAGPREPA